MLRHAHREEDADAVGCGDLVGNGDRGLLGGMPVIFSVYSSVNGSSDFLYSSKLLTHCWMNFGFAGR